MNREELEFLAEDDREDGEDYDVDISRRFCSATCACGFESYCCPFHDPVAPLSPQSWATLRAGLESARSESLGYLERLRRYDARGRTAYGFDEYDDEGYSCDGMAEEVPTAPSVTAGMMRAAFRKWRP